MNKKIMALATVALACIVFAATVRAAATNAPKIFSPGVISGPVNDGSATFTPDGRTVYFLRDNRKYSAIMVSHFKHGHWLSPKIASFSGQWRDFGGTMAPDGSYLVFASKRPLNGNVTAKGKHENERVHLWCVNRTSDGWSKPVPLPDNANHFHASLVFAPAIAADDTLYFTVRDGKGHSRLYRSKFKNGKYQAAKPLPFSTGQWFDMDPAIAPDQSFIIFLSKRPPASRQYPDLFIAFRSHGHWDKPVDMGSKIGKFDPVEIRLGPDGHTLYFASPHVVPPAYPTTKEEARLDLQRMYDWNDSTDNIWKFDLSPWLHAHGINH